MIHYIFSLPLPQVCAGMLLAVLLWSCLARFSAWRRLNVPLVALSVAAILVATIVGRDDGKLVLRLIPFHLLSSDPLSDDYFRGLLMNVLLFQPLGLSLSAALPSRWSTKNRFFRTLLAAATLSLLVELAQFIFTIGEAETDDLLMNSLGAALGASHVWVAAFFARGNTDRQK